MARWIDKDKLMEELGIKDDCKDCQYVDRIYFCTKSGDFTNVCESICDFPSIDIIRCKECKHWHKKDEATYCDRVDYGYGYKGDDFCSYGERKESE